MEAGAIRPGYELWRPNREKPESKSARARRLPAAGPLPCVRDHHRRLDASGGGKPLAILYAALYVLFAFLVTRWNRGVLPVAAALAIILAIFAAIAAPAWFDRAKDGLDNPALPEDLLGLLCLLLVPVQVILIAVAMVAFNQEWHVEEERPIGDESHPWTTARASEGRWPHPRRSDPLERRLTDDTRQRPPHDRRRAGLEKPERRLDQRRAVLAHVVDRVRDLGDRQVVGRHEQLLEPLEAGLRVEPFRLGLPLEDHRHAIVDRRHHLARRAGDDRAGVDRGAVRPASLRPEPGERERLA